MRRARGRQDWQRRHGRWASPRVLLPYCGIPGRCPAGSPLPFAPYPSAPPGGSPPVEPVRVLGLLHMELHGPGPMGALSSLAQTEVTLSGTAGQALAHILCQRPRQHPTHQVRRTPGEHWRLGSPTRGVRMGKAVRADMMKYFLHSSFCHFPQSSQLPRQVDCFIIPI